jgi:RNA polymerase sigma-70 factor (ECF subfamily)
MEALERVFRTWYQPLVALAISKFELSEDEARDVAQEAFFRLVRHQARVDNEGSWLAVVVLNECRARYRRRNREALALVQEAKSDTCTEAADRRILVSQAQRDLTEKEKRLLQLHFVEGRTAREIGTALGLTRSYVAKLLHLSIKVARRTCGEGP